ncbi:Asp23/Gls24 family envelope stress response protein [Candidatus Aerophobetes bacterium]|uniref:Asp23/Gls24 family envelope stress response protein n=1 Tax=Aerophobetes bacterium TaxID=2030807 RepID=A0A523YSC1_UNCAE|nr:MAG: Asp23/Gls24 family envelope stress response protein [Candidatus Aerophobetes bacterium]
MVTEAEGYEVDKRVTLGLIKKAVGQVKGIHGIKRSLFKEGIKVKKSEEGLAISLELLISEGGFVPQIVEEVQKKVKEEIEKTLGTKVAKVDIKIRGIKSSS